MKWLAAGSLLLAFLALTARADPAEWFARAEAELCPLTGLAPFKPRSPPVLCPQFEDSSCCVPQQDDDFSIIFNFYLSLGKGCQQTYRAQDATYRPFRDFFCIPCDPESVKHVKESSDPQDDVIEFRLCKTFVNALWGEDGSMYNECGLMYPLPCQMDINGTYFPLNGDRFECGDDLIIPSVAFEGPEQFMNGNVTNGPYFKPPEMDDLLFVIVDDIANPEAVCYKPKSTQYGAASVTSPLTFLPILLSVMLWTILGHFS